MCRRRPSSFLTLFFIVVAFAGYKFGQFRASQVPYAYFLTGLTTIAMATYGVTDPADVWQIGLNLDLGRGRVESSMLSRIDDELEAVAVAISEEFGILAEGYRPGEKLRSSPLNEAFATFEEKVSEIREQGAFSSTSLQTNLAFYGGFAALRSLRDELNNLRTWRRFAPPGPNLYP